MAKAELFLLLILSISFALIDPPVMEVHEHNTDIAPNEVLGENVLDQPEREPTLGNPTHFFYVKILTLSPSVNQSITSNQNLPHPQLIWLAAEKHNRTVVELYDSGDCDYRRVRRNYEDLEIESMTANYTLRGILYKGLLGDYSYNNASEEVLLADGGSTYNPSDIPFKKTLGCALMDFLTEHLLGGMFNLDCNEDSLVRASPYATGTYNATVRNLTIINPTVEVQLKGRFTINYTEDVRECHEEGDDCECDSWDSEGQITLEDGDFAIYEVQNDYMTVIAYSPAFLNLSANTSENVIYYSSILSNSNLYKYYSRMDGKTANAYYRYSFDVVNDSYGTQFIFANETKIYSLLPEDPESANNYTRERRMIFAIDGNYLRSPTEINNQSYNYSRSYNIKEVFYNLTPGYHHADLLFYTWWGNYSLPSDIYVKQTTMLSLGAYQSGADEITATCLLKDIHGNPVPGQAVEITSGDEKRTARTDGSGICKAVFSTNHTTAAFDAEFKGTDSLLPSDAQYVLLSTKSFFGEGIWTANFALLLLVSILVGMAFLNGASALGLPAQTFIMGKLVGGMAPKVRTGGKTIKLARVKKGKELAVSVAAAVATGGAGAAAAKKIGSDMAKKQMEKKMMREMAEKAKKKKGVGRKIAKKDEVGRGRGDTKGGRRKMMIAAGSGDDDDKRKRWLKDEIWEKCSKRDYLFTKDDLKKFEQITKKIDEETYDWLKKNFPEKFRRDSLTKLDRFVGKGPYDFAEKYCDRIPGIDKAQRDDMIEYHAAYPAKGRYNRNCDFFGVNIDKIQREHNYDKKEVQSCFIATTVHESLHSVGDFQNRYEGKNLEWAYEGLTEKMTRELMAQRFPEQQRVMRCGTYNGLLDVCREFEGLVGKKQFREAYFEKNFQKVYDRLLEKGMTKEEANQLLQVLNKCDARTQTGDATHKEAVEKIRELKRKVQESR